MSFRKVAVTCALMATLLSGCGIVAKPVAGTPHLLSHPGFHGSYDDPRPAREQCLRQHHIVYMSYQTKAKVHGTPQYLPAIKILRGGASVTFYPNAGTAEGVVIMGGGLGAELIGSALLYPHNTTGGTLTTVENCTAVGVG